MSLESQRPAKLCKVAKFRRDVCNQGTTYNRCDVCGAWDEGKCQLTEEGVAYKLLAAEHENQSKALAIKRAKELVKELVDAELERTKHTVEQQVDKKVERWTMMQGAWNTTIYLAALMFVFDCLRKLFS